MKTPIHILLFCLLPALTAHAQTTYPITWTNGTNISVNANNSLTKSAGGAAWNATIVSQNVLLPGQDGSIQFTYPGGTTNIYMVSLSKLNNDVSYVSNDYSLYINSSMLYIYTASTNPGPNGAVIAGDVIKVAREGTSIKFYKNATVLRTITLNNALDYLRADVVLHTGTVPVVTCSFPKALMVKPQFQFPGVANNDGSITLQLEGNTDPVTYSWSTGETTSSVTGKARGSYTVTTTDALSRTITKTYNLGYPVTWTNKINVNVNANNTLTKTGADGWGVSGASSANVLPPNTDGWVEFVVNEPTSYHLIGLSRFDADAHYASINYAWNISSTGSLYMQENGISASVVNSLMKGDVLRISREGSDIKYYLNGTVVRTTPTNTAYPLLVDVSIYNNWGPTPVVTTSFPAPPAQTYPIAWENGSNVTVNADNSLTKSGGIAGQWDAGNVSRNVLHGGSDGYLEFVHTGGSNVYTVGLTRLNNDPSYVVTDMSLYVNSNTLRLMARDAVLQTVAIVAGDVLKIAREGVNITFYKNGVLLRTVPLASYNILSTDFIRADVSIATGSLPVILSSFQPKFVVKSTVQLPTSANNDGAIILQAEGQAEPVTYTWSGGETSSSVSAKARGTYTATATDARGQTVSRKYGLGYPVYWTNITNLTVNADNSLSKSGAGWTSGASSLNVLPANTDGWVEFIINEPTAAFAVGLSRVDNGVNYTTINYSWLTNAVGGHYIYENGGQIAYMGGMMKGDVIRIAKENNVINYYFNGVLKRSVGGISNTSSFIVDVSLHANIGGAMPIVTASFDKKIRILPSIVLPDASNNAGSVAVTIDGTYAPHTISWSGGETSTTISNKPRGTYTLTVNDAASRTATRSYRLGYPIEWTDLQNASINPDNSISRVGGAVNTWDASAISANVLPPSTDGWVECILPSPANRTMFGLARMNTIASYTSIDYAFYFHSNGDVYIYELGTSRGIVASEEEGGVYTIAREGNNIKYYINGTVIRTITTDPTFQLFTDVAIHFGSSPRITSSFNRAQQTYYTIANGLWTSPSVWSLSEGGPPASVYPGPADIAIIKGNTVTINSSINSGPVNVIVTNANTVLKVDGAAAELNVKGKINVKKENNVSTTKALMVQNQARINTQ